MSLLEALSKKKKDLQHVTISVRDKTGAVRFESLNEDGECVEEGERQKGEGGEFFVVDTKPDAEPAKITDWLFVGSQDAASNIEALEKNNIKFIINLVPGLSPFFPDAFEYLCIPLLDLPETNILPSLESCFSFIDRARSFGSACLVHWFVLLLL